MIIICHRDPDSSNEFVVFAEGQPDPQIHDIDYGYADLRDPEEFEQWYENHRAYAEHLKAKVGTPNALRAAAHVIEAIDEARENYQG